MTWRVSDSEEIAFASAGGREANTSAFRVESAASLKHAAGEAAGPVGYKPGSYPDHWWSPDFWNDLRLAGRYAAINVTILPKLPIPPSKEEEIRAELDHLLKLQDSDERQKRMPEILEEAIGPPAYYRRMLFLNDNRNPQVAALLARLIPWSRMFIMTFKHHWKRPRPMQLEPCLRPAIDCPHHAAFPSGHSTQSHLVALLMGAVTGRDDVREALWAAADRIAENREYAGVHYPSDSRCGVALAQAVFPLFEQENATAIQRAREEYQQA